MRESDSYSTAAKVAETLEEYRAPFYAETPIDQHTYTSASAVFFEVVDE